MKMYLVLHEDAIGNMLGEPKLFIDEMAAESYAGTASEELPKDHVMVLYECRTSGLFANLTL